MKRSKKAFLIATNEILPFITKFALRILKLVGFLVWYTLLHNFPL